MKSIVKNMGGQNRGREGNSRETGAESNRDSGRENYRAKIRRHKMTVVYRVLLVLLILGILTAIVYVQYRGHVYTDYETVSTASINQAEGTNSMRLGDHILTYSHDGAHCTTMDGVEVWNQTFEMQNMIVTAAEDVVAIGDYNGNEVYVLNTAEKICQINTTMPIRNIAVSATGRVAVAVSDTKVTWIYIYEADGTKEYEVKTTMSQSGYPITFGFSPDGELLAVSCVFVDAGVVKSQVAFYNFGSVGSNKTDFFVNGYTYPDVIIPYIQFVNDSYAVAVGDDRLVVYSGSQKPTLLAEHLFEDEIRGVYQNGDYIGLLFRSDVLEMQNKMEVYRYDSEKKGTYYFNTDFNDIFFTKDYFAVYGASECLLMTYDNTKKFSGDFEKTVDLMLPIGKGTGYKFAIVSDGTIDVIQLK